MFEDFKKNGVVAVGWRDVGDLSRIQSRQEIRRIVERVYKDQKPHLAS